MCRLHVVLFSLLVATMNLSAQDSTPPLHTPSAKEKEQALAALTAAGSILFPLKHKPEARQLIARIAPLLAAVGDIAGAQEVLMLLPAKDRDAIQPQIVAAQIRTGDVGGALQTATAIRSDDPQAAALLLVVEAQAKSGEVDAAMRTAGLIAAERVESVQALLEVVEQQKLAGKRGEATQLLRHAAAAAAGLMNSNGGEFDCGLSVLTQIANIQESLGQSAEALKTLQLAEGRVSEADAGCKLGAVRYLQDDDAGRPEGLKNEIAGFRERLDPTADSTGNEEQNEGDSSSAEENGANATSAIQPIQLQQPSQNGQATLTREQAQAALDSLRRVRPLYLRAREAMITSQMLMAGGRTREAEEAIQVGLEVAEAVQDDNLRGMLVASKAHALAEAKDWEGACAAVGEIANGPQRTNALVDIASSAVENGHAQLALSWATEEASPLSEASVLVAIAEALLHQPQQTYFIQWLHS